MKATGIVRRIDDLGRVVIPKEIRRTLRLRDGDPMEIFTDREGTVILKKYSPIGDMADFAEEFAESAGKILGNTAVITDRDQVIAVSGSSVRDLLEKQISDRLADLLEENNRILITDSSNACYITNDDRQLSFSGSRTDRIPRGSHRFDHISIHRRHNGRYRTEDGGSRRRFHRETDGAQLEASEQLLIYSTANRPHSESHVILPAQKICRI